MKRILIVGGANGIGLSVAQLLADRSETEHICIVDKSPTDPALVGHPKVQSVRFDLSADDYSLFDRFTDIDTLLITAGMGRLALFRDISETDIVNYMNINATSVMRIISHFYSRLESANDFRCGVMVSIAGFMSSPFFSVYAASKAALKVFIESVNVELEKAGTANRILNISPGSIRGTRFGGAHKTDLEAKIGRA